MEMRFDVVLVGDFRVPGGTSRQSANAIRALHAAGYSVGLVTVELPHAQGRKPINPLIRERVSLGEATIVQRGEDVIEAGLTVLENPRAFMNAPEFRLKIDSQNAILVNHFPLIDGAGQYTFDPYQVLEVCSEIVTADITWAPVSGAIRHILGRHTPDLPLLNRDLPNIVDIDEFRTRRTRPLKTIPVIGRHSRPEKEKWPATREKVLEVYPNAADIEVALLGVGKPLAQLMGRFPGNWRTYEFNEIAPADFLRTIDFFVYYHHPSWVEAFGIAIAEAMASGAVAILPPHFETNFGGAALYRDPEHAVETVRELHANWRDYRAQSRRGREFVRRRHSPRRYLEVLEPLLPRPSGRIGRGSQLAPGQTHLRFDVTILSDMSRPGCEAVRVAEEIRAQAQAGYATGLVHLPQKPTSGRVRPEIDDCVWEGLATVIDPREHRVSTRILVVHSPAAVLSNISQVLLEVEAGHTIVIVSKIPDTADDLALTDRLLRKLYKGSVSWAPTTDLTRIWLEENGAAIVIEPVDWRPIVARTAEKPRRVLRKQPVIGRVEVDDSCRWLDKSRKISSVYPGNDKATVRVHGVPEAKRLQRGVVPEKWETFRAFEINVGKFLDGTDFLVYQHGISREQIPDMAVVLAMSKGIPPILSFDFERYFGGGAVYCEPRATFGLVRDLHSSPRRFMARSRAALDRARRFHAPHHHRDRLAALIKKTGGKARPKRTGFVTESPRNRVLMFSQNGIGLGHVTRQLAVAHHLSRSHGVVFASMSQALHVVDRFGYQVEYVPSHVYAGTEYADWQRWTRDHLNQMIEFYNAGVVVLDGSVPYQALIEAVAPRPEVRLAWIRRTMWRRDGESEMRIRLQRFFDVVIEPGDIAESLDKGPTVDYRERATRVDPIRLLDAPQLLSRTDAAAALGLEADRPAVLIQLGSGINRDIVGIIDRILDACTDVPGLQVVIAEWLNSADQLDLWPGVRRFSGFPISLYYNAFDFSVSAAGYNTFHEVISFGLPTIFVGNPRQYMDDQTGRAEFAARRKAAIVSDGTSNDLAAAIGKLARPRARQSMKRAMTGLVRPNGARSAAAAISKLLQR